MDVDTLVLAGLSAWSVLVTAVTGWMVLGWRRSGFRGRKGLGRLAAGVVWALLVFAAGLIAARYIERIPVALIGWLGFAALSFLLSLGRAALYRRAWQHRPAEAELLRRAASFVHQVSYLLLATAVYFGLALIAGGTVQLVLLLPLFLGALLPDLDSQSSPLGRLLPFASRRLEARFGHRGACHSLGANALLALVTLPVAALFGVEAWALLSLGFLTHLLLDLLEPRGCMLLWPVTHRRITVSGRHFDRSQSAAGHAVAIGLVLVVGVLFPLVDIGPPPAAPVRPPSFGQGLHQYQSIRGRNLALADVAGTWQATGRPQTGRYEILSAVGQSLVMLDRYSGRVFTAGQGASDNLYLNRVSVVSGEPIRVKPVEVHIEDGELREALPVLYEMQGEPGLQHIFVSGDVVLPHGAGGSEPALPPDLSQTTLRRIQEVGPGHSVLRFLTAAQLIDLAGLQVDSAELVIVATYYAAPDPAVPTVTPLPLQGETD